ncbi:ABC transporter permease [Streptomyces sp. NBC_01304]|uniref:ABC transporter permease n=1 Tax=Streptomyces sp. NBC_01304 TaxID=2903818 RepID=UPI002E13F460|nr:ABC transporter permease subunit [Streptomyces sp. NBC_01304]
MKLTTTRPTRGLSWVDFAVAAAVLVLGYLILQVGKGTTVSFNPAHVPDVDTSPSQLPYYGARSLLRMFIALAASVLFTFVYAYAAARSRRLERILIPALDILQSVPVLGFLTIAVTGFIALFPGSLLGLECASIFAIFTSQAWNMTFGFYQTLTSLPRELDEVSRSFGFTKWMRFWKIEVPSGMIDLVWNGMMSFAGGWFMLVASEAISIGNEKYVLPGVGSYAGTAIGEGDLGKVGWAILTMAVMVIGVNFLFWRPLTAWSEKFKNEQSESTDVQRSFVLDFLRRSNWAAFLGKLTRPPREALGRAARVLGRDDKPLSIDPVRRRNGDIVFNVVAGALIAWGLYDLLRYLQRAEGFGIFLEPLWLGLITLIRVIVLCAVATVIWVPIGVKIGFSPKLAKIAQPVVQVLASFPANFLFPLAMWFFLKTGLDINIGCVLLMALGAQWYILFNTIAGAMAIPSDLKEAMDDLGVHGWQRWKRLIIPGIFPSYVTGGITASGGAWNASIVAEVVTFGGSTLTATGLGAYIANATGDGDFPKLIAGVAVMSLYVVTLNRLFWRRLYKVAEARYTL